jgi:hypothetical protein
MIAELYKHPNDSFLVDWFCEFFKNRKICQIERILQTYEIIKRKLMELNCGRETQFGKMEEIPFDVVESWEMLIRANIFDGEGLSVADLSKSCRVIGKTFNIIVVPYELGV